MSSSEAQKKTLFIVKATEKTLGFEIFLRNRSWNIVATNDLKQALSSLFSHQIHCVLIAVDHSNPKCLKLPGIIAQTLKVPVILFGESMSQSAMSHLRATTHPYVIAPPVSGPAIERMLLKIERDQNAVPIEKPEGANAHISISGPAGEPDAIHMQGSRLSMDQIVQMFEGDESSAAKKSDSADLERSGPITPRKGITAPRLGGSPSSGESVPTNPRNALEGLAIPKGLGAEKQGEPAVSNSSALSTRPRSAHTPGSSSTPTAQRRSHRPLTDEEMFEQTSLLILGVEQALKNASVQIDLPESRLHQIQKITHDSHTACFELTAPSFSGVMVLAFGSKHSTGQSFGRDFKDILARYLDEHQIEASINEMPDFQLENASLEEWSMSEAVFLRKSVHHDGEVVAAFFPHQQTDSRVHLSAEAHMSRVNLREIRRDVHLEFDIYLYFPVNRKYIRYAAKGRNMFDSQRTRLEDGGVTDIHIRKENERDVTRYHVQNFLNDKIRVYQTKTDDEDAPDSDVLKKLA